MAVRLSTGLRNFLCAEGSLRDALQGKVLKLYSGPVPATANSAIPGDSVLLCVISTGGSGAGLNWEGDPQSGALAKSASDSWEGLALEDGTATYYRLCTDADDGESSSVAVRLQGSVAAIYADLLLSQPTLSQGAVQRIGEFFITIPAE